MEKPVPPPLSDAHAVSPQPSPAEALGLTPHRGDEALDRLLGLLARMCAAPIAAFCIEDHDRHFMASSHGLRERALLQRSALMQAALAQDEVLLVADATKDSRYVADPLVTGAARTRSLAAVSVRGPGRRRLGVLCVMDPAPDRFDDQAAAALRQLQAVLEDRLRLRADVLHDPLTGAISRRYFDEIADREWRRAMRALVPVSMIVCELDRVHEFAAREGNAALDRGLRATALAMQYSLHRPGDCIGRYDETHFALLLPGTDEPGATETAERVREAVEGLRIPFAEAAPSSFLTLSAGVATVHSESLTRGDPATAVRAATVALRHAQGAGGNRCTLAGAHGELLLPR